jgi:hypothetical protein
MNALVDAIPLAPLGAGAVIAVAVVVGFGLALWRSW